MNVKSSTKYGFTTQQDGKDYYYKVVQLSPVYRILEGGYGRSQCDAAECARAAIRRLEAGTQPAQQAAA